MMILISPSTGVVDQAIKLICTFRASQEGHDLRFRDEIRYFF